MRWLVIVVCAGCWSSSEPTAEHAENTDQPLPALVQAAHPKHAGHSVWRGRYQCAQGPTALLLTMDHAGPTLAATFDFGPLDENPLVPHGTYTMTGEATSSSGHEITVKLAPKAWLEQPPGYIMVGIEATTDPERRTLRGHITYATCGSVELSRVE